MKYKSITLRDNLREDTQKFIKSIIDEFDANNNLSNLDEIALHILANSLNSYLECEDIIETEGITTTNSRGSVMMHPAFLAQRSLASQIQGILKEMGLFLGSRSRIKQNLNETDSPLIQLLKNQ